MTLHYVACRPFAAPKVLTTAALEREVFMLSLRSASNRALSPLAILWLLLLSLGTAQAQYGGGGAEGDDEDSRIELPESLEPNLRLLDEEQLEFLQSSKTRPFARTTELLIEQLERRSPEEVKAYVEAMMFVHDQRNFDEDRDSDELPLNTAAPDFNAWHVRRPSSFDPDREAGPIELRRYMGGWGGGIPTFAGAPIALTPEDLIAGEVDVAIVGAPLNMGSGFRGADHGPMAIRMARGLAGNDMATQVNPSRILNIVDYGDIAVDQDSSELSVRHVREVLREIVEAGVMPVIIGGDHSLEYPAVAALVDVFGKGNVTAIHFDAHHDIGRNSPHYITHGSPIYRLLREELITGADYIQVGLRGGGPSAEQFRWMREEGFIWHTHAEIERYGWDIVMERVLASARARGENRKFHISFDIDLLDPTYVPGTGTPVSNGLTPREVIPVIRRLCAQNDVVSFDLVELAPALDPTYVSAQHAAAIVKACLVGVAMRKEGMSANHLDPRAVYWDYKGKEDDE